MGVSFSVTSPIRVSAFIDGFNLYHAIDDLGAHYLKWVNLRALCEEFAPSPQYVLTHTFYFSAYATWRLGAYARHREFVRALRFVGVTPVMGKFKPKDRTCKSCGHKWVDHEEKQTDVNIGLHLLREAFNNTYDRALLITGDSDLVPAVSLVRSDFPQKDIRIIAPVGRGHSMDLLTAVGGKANCRRMKTLHLERCLLASIVSDESGNVVATRPPKYEPPKS